MNAINPVFTANKLNPPISFVTKVAFGSAKSNGVTRPREELYAMSMKISLSKQMIVTELLPIYSLK